MSYDNHNSYDSHFDFDVGYRNYGDDWTIMFQLFNSNDKGRIRDGYIPIKIGERLGDLRKYEPKLYFKASHELTSDNCRLSSSTM